MNTKSLLVGAVVGWLSMIAGLQVAKADCDQDVWSSAQAPVEAARCGGVVTDDNGDEAAVLCPQSYAQAAAEAAMCDTNYGEVVAVAGGFEAYCVPDHSAEACIEVSSLLDCSGMSDEACDETMGVMFEACVVLYHAGR